MDPKSKARNTEDREIIKYFASVERKMIHIERG